MITDFFEMVKYWTVSDYKTPGIKAEVILDMLISDFVEDLLAYHFKKEKTALLAKELPIRINESNLNAKVDYLAAVGSKKLVLVELKTANESYSAPQNKRMENAAKNGTAEKLIEFYRSIPELPKLKSSAKKKYKYSLKMYEENLRKNNLCEGNFSELDYLYILLTDSDKVPDDKKIVLADYFNNADFENSLSERRELWDKVSSILKLCADFNGESAK
ncbi:MAG: hypothetical protein NC299_16000 [Lachnospiraceae bacterium]|nr:hypothetical protein [Ruminococcus sp.]MCM1276838.1 hypothetical protein [Lachnospiraceae bacterium]